MFVHTEVAEDQGSQKNGHSKNVSAQTLPKLVISRMEGLITAADCDLTRNRVAVAT